jgi:hypothetical protein
MEELEFEVEESIDLEGNSSFTVHPALRGHGRIPNGYFVLTLNEFEEGLFSLEVI